MGNYLSTLRKILSLLGAFSFLPAAVLAEPEVYQYTMRPGSAAWANATVDQRRAACIVPKTYRESANTKSLLQTAVLHPWFRSAQAGTTIAVGYNALRQTSIMATLADLEARPDYGTEMKEFFRLYLQPNVISQLWADDFSGFNYVDYQICCYMASRDVCLNTMVVASRQTMFKIGIFDTVFFGSGDPKPGCAAALLVHTIYAKPASYRGTLPDNLLTPLTGSQVQMLENNSMPPEVLSEITNAKATLGITTRP